MSEGFHELVAVAIPIFIEAAALVMFLGMIAVWIVIGSGAQ